MTDSFDFIPVYCLSLNHRRANENIRKLFAFSDKECDLFSENLLQSQTGIVVVSTCNRTEWFISCANNEIKNNPDSMQNMLSELECKIATFKGEDVSLLRKYCFSYCGIDAVRHLFSVASGLESMILGENQILGQIRDSYQSAKEHGFTDFFLNVVFHKALTCAKRIKTETNLSKTTESVATLTVKELMKRENMRNILVIGASGQTGSLIVKDLSERENVHVWATMRQHYTLPDLPNVEKIPYDERYCVIDAADAVVSATKSPHYTVNASDVASVIKTKKPRLFIDLAIPPDIDKGVSSLECTELKSIDWFSAVAAEHNAQKQQGTIQAGEIIKEELDSLKKELIFHKDVQFLSDLKDKLEKKNSLQFLYELRKFATADEVEMILSVCHRMFNKCNKGE